MSAPLEGIRVVEVASFVAAPSAGRAAGGPGRRSDQGRGARGGALPAHPPAHERLLERHRPVAGVRDGQPRQALAGARPDPARGARRARARDRALGRAPHQPAARAAAALRARSRDAARAQARARARDTQRLRHARRRSRPAGLRLHRVLGAQRHDGPHARARRHAGLPAARSRRPRRRACRWCAGSSPRCACATRRGVGQAIEVSLLQIGMYIQGNDFAQALVAGESPPMHDRKAPRNPLWNLYPTADARWLMLVMVDSIKYWPAVCRALGLRRARRPTRASAARSSATGTRARWSRSSTGSFARARSPNGSRRSRRPGSSGRRCAT